MSDAIFMEIANEIKGLHNGALAHMKKNEFAEADVQYRKALIITEKIKYYEGMAITLFNMANLSVVVDDLIEAIKNAADARDMFNKAGLPHDDCDDLIHTLAASGKKKGISLEKKGKFQEAIDHFEAFMPYVDEESRAAMEYETNLLRKIISDKKQENS